MKERTFQQIKAGQWLQFCNPCKNERIMGIKFETCEDSCTDGNCSDRFFHKALWNLLDNNKEDYNKFLRKAVEYLPESEQGSELELLNEDAEGLMRQIETLNKNCLDVTDSFLSVMSEEEIELLNDINNVGDYLIKSDDGEPELRTGLYKIMKGLVKEALKTGLSGLDGIAKLGVIFGMEEKVKQLEYMPYLREEMRLRSPMLENS